MNKYLMIGLAFLTAPIFCQEKHAVRPTYCPELPVTPDRYIGDNDIFSLPSVEVRPEFPGGMHAFFKAFHAEYQLPADTSDLTGRIFITFTIEKDGSVTDLNVLRDFGGNSGTEAVRVIKNMPKWTPAQYQKKPVRCKFTIPIKFPYEPRNAASQQKIKEILDKH